MKKMRILLLSSISLLVLGTSCVKNKGEVSYSYNKAIAQYDYLEAIRNQGLVEAPRPISDIGKVFYGTDIILIGERNKGIHIINNANRNIPTKPSFLSIPYCNEFFVDGNFLYAESHYDILKIDISNKSNPILVHRAKNAISQPIKNNEGKTLVGFTYQFVHESFKLNSAEELALRKSNTLYFDYSNNLIPSGKVPPSFVSSSAKNKGTMSRMEVADGYLNLITSSQLYTYDISGGSIISTKKQTIGNDLETIYHEDNKLFIGSKSSMTILNNNNPSEPYVLSSYWHEVSCDPVLPNDDIAYLTLRSVQDEGCSGGTVNLLKVIDISNPSSPSNITDVTMRSPYGMTISNDHLFIGEGANGITVMDITNPNNPTEIFNTSSFKTYDVIKHPNDSDIILVISDNDVKQLSFDESSNTIQELNSLLSL